MSGLSRLYRSSSAALTSGVVAFSESKGPPGMAFIVKNVMMLMINSVKMASRTRFQM